MRNWNNYNLKSFHLRCEFSCKTSLPKMSTWRHQRQRPLQNFEVLVSNSGYAPASKSWRRLEDVYNVTILPLSRRFQDVFKTFSRRLPDVLKISWRYLGRWKIVSLKTTSGPWRRLGDQQHIYWEGIYVCI